MQGYASNVHRPVLKGSWNRYSVLLCPFLHSADDVLNLGISCVAKNLQNVSQCLPEKRNRKDCHILHYSIIMQPQNESCTTVGKRMRQAKRNPNSSSGLSYSKELESFLRVITQKSYVKVCTS